MSMRRILAVVLIFAVACAGWWILGTATAVRSLTRIRGLGASVESLWGGELVQTSPSFAAEVPGTDQVRWVLPVSNQVQVQLLADYRKKGLVWYPTYICSFSGTYTVSNEEDVTQKIRLHFGFPAPKGTYDDFAIAMDGKPLASPIDTEHGVGEIIELAPGQHREFSVSYKTRGLRTWRYRFDENAGRVRNLQLSVATDFGNIDYTDGSLSPMSSEGSKDGGMNMEWMATDLITTQDIGIVIPEKLNPGPVTTRITFFAPVCLLFFFVLVATINILYKVNIHPMHYLFVAAGFFAFHLLLSYLVGLIGIHASFIISAVISVSLVTSYLSAALRGRFPWKVAVAGQLFFLILFSYSFFFTGITGLTVAIGSVVTLAVLMRVTAHVDWDSVFARPPEPPTRKPPPEEPVPAPLPTA